MECNLKFAAELGLWELTLSCDRQLAWFLLEPEEADMFRRLIDELDPGLKTLRLVDVCGLVRAVTGAPPDTPTTGQPLTGLE